MNEHQVCTMCVMDTSAPGIVFDDRGQCNFCRDFEARLGDPAVHGRSDRERAGFIAEVKKQGRGKDYDCIVGVSGGVDSSYALYLAVKHGLRPLAVHLDNGWNSELASHNIANLITTLKVDLVTHVIDWEENRDLQRAFFAANVIDIELLMDNAMLATNFAQARRFGVKYILAGTNNSTEGMTMPLGWNHHKWDKRNIKAIHRRFGRLPIRTHPLYGTWEFILDQYVRRIRWISFLDYFDYNKAEAIAILQRECGYRPYAHKHYESVFTRFYQGYILPNKFGVDKRRLHLSTLVVSGQQSREDALAALEQDPYPDPDQKREDKTFVLKKLGFSEAGFDEYVAAPPVPHAHYGSEAGRMRFLGRLYHRLRGRARA
ncbi:N-acetyl sugar amidotransferase [Sphingosinicella rhizophila]|uniref:N-acetyl sugar amidotransferase n=1 Tax=Sphingosinicella rhizophila TaxID=3050082 RepID=A0ABU3Q8I6_9SPHN|nr:N-acetyl sugar amidotransferase [Sphingosinicella sp. GR2756]MDT9599637.1 N-acetyl sugar amidotransferase [Sphingosinicella sp. GR2756]